MPVLTHIRSSWTAAPYPTLPDGVSLPATLTMARGDHDQMRVVLVTLFRPEEPTARKMEEMNSKIMERDIKLE